MKISATAVVTAMFVATDRIPAGSRAYAATGAIECALVEAADRFDRAVENLENESARAERAVKEMIADAERLSFYSTFHGAAVTDLVAAHGQAKAYCETLQSLFAPLAHGFGFASSAAVLANQHGLPSDARPQRYGAVPTAYAETLRLAFAWAEETRRIEEEAKAEYARRAAAEKVRIEEEKKAARAAKRSSKKNEVVS